MTFYPMLSTIHPTIRIKIIRIIYYLIILLSLSFFVGINKWIVLIILIMICIDFILPLLIYRKEDTLFRRLVVEEDYYSY
jgi:hypothetical protein